MHGSNSAQLWRSPSSQLLAWVMQFKEPHDPESLLLQLHVELRAEAEQALKSLQKIGVLQRGDSAPPAPLDSDQRIRILLQQIARLSYVLAADAQGFGPFAETRLRESFGQGLEARLYAIGAAMFGLRQDLQSLRAEHVQRQAAQLGLHPDMQDLLLHIGCGPVHLNGFVNIDIAPAPLAMNVLWGLPFEDSQARAVYLSHLLEHLFYPNDVQFVLSEAQRVLQRGGIIRLVVPDIARCLRAYHERDAAFFQARREHFAWWPDDASMLENFLTYAGVGTEPGFLFESHKYGYDFETLHKVLTRAGFTAIRQCAFQQSALPELRVEHLSEAARWRAGTEYLSLFVEARKA
jgi:SAM-dependent methyltransferase